MTIGTFTFTFTFTFEFFLLLRLLLLFFFFRVFECVCRGDHRRASRTGEPRNVFPSSESSGRHLAEVRVIRWNEVSTKRPLLEKSPQLCQLILRRVRGRRTVGFGGRGGGSSGALDSARVLGVFSTLPLHHRSRLLGRLVSELFCFLLGKGRDLPYAYPYGFGLCF